MISFYKMLKNIICQCDFLSPAPKLRIQSLERFKNLFGGGMSILVSVIIFGISLYFAVITFSRKDINAMYNEVPNDLPVIDVFNFPILISIVDRFGLPFKEPSRIYDIYSIFWYSNTTSHTLQTEMIDIDEHCYENFKSRFPNYKEYSIINKTTYCLNPNEKRKNTTLHGIYGDGEKEFSFLSFYVTKCMNDSNINKTSCYSQEILDQTLQEVYFVITLIDYNINNNNYTNPGIAYLKNLINPISQTIFKRYYIKFRNVEYKTDDGFIFESIRTDYFTKIEPVLETADNRNQNQGIFKNNFAIFTLMTSEIKQIYSRSYMKLQNLLANIGGIIKGIMFIAIFIENYFVTNIYINALARELLQFSANEIKSSELSRSPLQFSQLQIFQIGKSQHSLPNENVNNNKKENIGINLTWKDHVLGRLCKTTKMKDIHNVQRYLNHKSSIDFILKKLMELEIAKYVIFSTDELKQMQMISRPHFLLIADKENFSPNAIQILWKNFELSCESGKEEMIGVIDDMSTSPFHKRIIDLLK